MPNTFSNLVPDAYKALDVVSRELVGFIPSVYRDSSTDRVAVGQTLRVPYTAPNSAGGDITPAMAFPSASYQTISNRSLTITKQRFYPFSWQNEERYALDQGPGHLNIFQDQLAQGMRALCNEIELDLFNAAYVAASRAYGTAGTTAFASNVGDAAQVRKILDDNGAPLSGRVAVIDTTAGAALRSLTNLTKVNEAGQSMTLTQGELVNLSGISFKESAQVSAPTVGSGASYVVNNSGGYAVGSTAITVGTGSGTILAGDIITFAGDSNKYVVASALASNVVTLQEPGLRKAVANTTAVTVVAAATRNVVFTQNAILLATRLPVSPAQDLAMVKETVTDARSGLSFEIAAYPGIDMVTYHIRAVWGVLAVKPRHIATLLG